MVSLLPSAIVLGLAALLALFLARSRPSPLKRDAERVAAARVLALATGIQAIHFAEEAMTGFQYRLGDVFGIPEMPTFAFLVFNVSWLLIWAVSIPGVRSGRVAAFFAAWFLAIAGMFNLVAHPLLALVSGGYFPGLASSSFIGGVSIWLHVRLMRATRTE